MQHLAWPFFDDSHRALAPEVRAWAERSLHGHDDESRDAIDAACRQLVAPSAMRDSRATACRARTAARRRLRRARDLPGARDARRIRRPGRLRVRDARPRQRRDLDRRIATRCERATCRRSRRAARSPPSRCPSPTRLRRRGDAVLCASRRRSLRARRREDLDLQRRHRRFLLRVRAHARQTRPTARGARGISAFVVDADAPGFEIAQRIDVIAPHPLARAALRRLPRSARRAHRRRRRRLQDRDAHARRLPHLGRRGRARLRAARARRGARARARSAGCSARRSPTSS